MPMLKNKVTVFVGTVDVMSAYDQADITHGRISAETSKLIHYRYISALKYGDPFTDNEGNLIPADELDHDNAAEVVWQKDKKVFLDICKLVDFEIDPKQWEGIDTEKDTWKNDLCELYPEFADKIGRHFFALLETGGTYKTPEKPPEISKKDKNGNPTQART